MNQELEILNTFDLQLLRFYSQYAQISGISETAFWIYMGLIRQPEGMRQNELAENFGYPLQTINSCIKKMEKDGLIMQESLPGQGRRKRVRLSPYGLEQAQRIAAPVCQAEENAFDHLSVAEQKQLSLLLRRYMQAFESEMNVLISPETRTEGK